MLGEFLVAGHIFDGEFFPPSDYGVSVRSGLSPIMANMALDGLQNAIYKGLYGFGAIDYANGDMIRSADDVIM